MITLIILVSLVAIATIIIFSTHLVKPDVAEVLIKLYIEKMFQQMTKEDIFDLERNKNAFKYNFKIGDITVTYNILYNTETITLLNHTNKVVAELEYDNVSEKYTINSLLPEEDLLTIINN